MSELEFRMWKARSLSQARERFRPSDERQNTFNAIFPYFIHTYILHTYKHFFRRVFCVEYNSQSELRARKVLKRSAGHGGKRKQQKWNERDMLTANQITPYIRSCDKSLSRMQKYIV